MPPKAGAYRAEQLSQLAGLTQGSAPRPKSATGSRRARTTCRPARTRRRRRIARPTCANGVAITTARRSSPRGWWRSWRGPPRWRVKPGRRRGANRTFPPSRRGWRKFSRLVREQAECWGYTTCAYDALLEGYEPGARAAELDARLRRSPKATHAACCPGCKKSPAQSIPRGSRAIIPCAASRRLTGRSPRRWASISRRAESIRPCILSAPRWGRRIAA